METPAIIRWRSFIGDTLAGHRAWLRSSAFLFLSLLVFWLPACVGAGTPLGSADFLPSPAHPVGWRGDGSGQYPAAEPVIRWSATENVLWEAEVGAGHSSPIVVGKRLFLTVEPDLLLCLDTETGKELWRKAHPSELPRDPETKNPKYSSQYGDITPTPVSDGQAVWVFVGTGVVACHGLDGQTRWRKSFDFRPATTYGRTVSPVLVGKRLLVHFGPLVCLDAETGEVIWKNETAKATYGTPAPARIGGVDVVITPKGQVVRVADGKVLAADLGNCMYTSPVVRSNVVFFIDGTLSAARLPEAAAEQIECQELWAADLPGDFYASPLIDGGRIHTVDKAGRYYVLDAVTGKILLNKKLELSGAGGAENANVYPSLCQAGKYLYVSNDAGETAVLDPGGRAKLSSVNRLPAGSGASLVFSGRRIYLRGGKFLYCVASQ